MLSLVIAPSVALAQNPTTPETVGTLEADFVLGQVIVKFRESSDQALDRQMIQGELLRAGLGPQPILTTSGGELLLPVGSDSITARSADDLRSQTLAAVEMWRNNPAVEYAELNYLMDSSISP